MRIILQARAVMVHLLIRHKVKEFESWKAAFDAAFTFRKNAGESSFHLYRDIHDPSDVTLWFEWESAASAEEFVASEELARQMQLAGVEGTPEMRILHEMLSMRRTAAD
jgi:quinol monooxygenase YgiN